MLFKSFCVRGYFHSLLYRSLRVPATFLKSPSQLLLFKQFDWLIQTGFSLFDSATGVTGLIFVFFVFFVVVVFGFFVLFCFVLSTLRTKENNQKKTETHADLNTELLRIFLT